MRFTRQEALDLFEELIERIEEDRVTADDDRALAALSHLRYYLTDHMTDEDFELSLDDEEGMVG